MSTVYMLYLYVILNGKVQTMTMLGGKGENGFDRCMLTAQHFIVKAQKKKLVAVAKCVQGVDV